MAFYRYENRLYRDAEGGIWTEVSDGAMALVFNQAQIPGPGATISSANAGSSGKAALMCFDGRAREMGCDISEVDRQCATKARGIEMQGCRGAVGW